MMIEIPGKVLAAEKIQQPNGSVSDQQPAIGPDCGGRKILFHSSNELRARLFIVYSEHCAFRRLQTTPQVAACGPSIAGSGVVGPCGPRTGNSSGILPGSSSGRAGSPGSRTGGGISGRGLPGGASGGGSVGLPGVAGGISGGSIGILCIANHVAPSLSRYRQR
jgi:hypothetical protein